MTKPTFALPWKHDQIQKFSVSGDAWFLSIGMIVFATGWRKLCKRPSASLAFSYGAMTAILFFQGKGRMLTFWLEPALTANLHPHRRKSMSTSSATTPEYLAQRNWFSLKPGERDESVPKFLSDPVSNPRLQQRTTRVHNQWIEQSLSTSESGSTIFCL